MFEKASRLKLRFKSEKGELTVEDLWELPLTGTNGRVNLDDIARGLHRQLKNDEDVSFVIKDKKSDAVIQLKFDVVKHIIEVRLAEDNARMIAQDNAAKKQQVLKIIAEREDEELKGMSKEELTKLANELS